MVYPAKHYIFKLGIGRVYIVGVWDTDLLSIKSDYITIRYHD